MTLDSVLRHALDKAHVTEDFPFGEDTLVLKVGGKMFAAIGLERNPLGVNLKCDPEKALELRASNENVLPGYHMNKKHWNTVILKGSLSNSEIKEMIDHSYDLVVRKMSKKEREILGL